MQLGLAGDLVGMFFVVFGILRAARDLALMAVLLLAGAAFLAAFFLYARARERADGSRCSRSQAGSRTGRPTSDWWRRTFNGYCGWACTVSVFLPTVRGYNAIQTGVIFPRRPLGVLVSSLAAERLARRRPPRTLIIAGFVVTSVGIVLLLALIRASLRAVAFGPDLSRSATASE